MKKDIYELEVLNKHLVQEREVAKVKNEIFKTQNEKILLNLCHWYKTNKKIKVQNKFLRNTMRGLQRRSLLKKPRIMFGIKNKK